LIVIFKGGQSKHNDVVIIVVLAHAAPRKLHFFVFLQTASKKTTIGDRQGTLKVI
jgi:hypothetical protein